MFARPIERPAGFIQHEVDERVAGFGLRVVMGVGLGASGIRDHCHFGPQTLPFVVESGLVGKQRAELLVALAQALRQPIQLVCRGLGCGGISRESRGIEYQARRRSVVSSVGASEPVRDLEEFAHGSECILDRGIGR